MAQIDSQYRRLQRFFSGFSPAVFTPKPREVLVMDRTHWKLGRTDLNLLCVGLVYQGVLFRWPISVAKAGQLPYRRT